MDEAEHELRAVLEIHTRLFGPECHDTLISRNNLALALRAQGRPDKAEREWRTILDLHTRLSGADHPDTLTIRSNLGLT